MTGDDSENGVETPPMDALARVFSRESDLFGLLGNDYRRAVIVYLDHVTLDDSESVEVGAVAKAISEVNHGEPSGARRRNAVYVNLTRNHLQKLAIADVIEWVRDTQTIRPGPRFGDAAAIIHAVYGQRLAADAHEDEDGDGGGSGVA